MAVHDVVFPNGPDPVALQSVLAQAGFDARPNTGGGFEVSGAHVTVEPGAVVFRVRFAPDQRPADEAHEAVNTLNYQLDTARAVYLDGGLVVDHMVRADVGVAQSSLINALRAFLRDVDLIAGRPVPDAEISASDGLDVPSLIAMLARNGLAAQPSPETGFAIAEHEGIRFLVDLTRGTKVTFAAYFGPPEDGTDRTTRLAFANYMNGRYMLDRVRLNHEGNLVVDCPLIRGGSLVEGTFARTARSFAVVALRIRQAVMQGWVHTPLPS